MLNVEALLICGLAVNMLMLVGVNPLLGVVLASSLTIITVNYLALLKIPGEYANIFIPILWSSLSYALLKLIGINDIFNELSLIIMFTSLVVLSWDTEALRSIFSPITPPAILASSLIAGYTGFPFPSRLIILAIIDALAGRSITDVNKKTVGAYTQLILFALSLNLSPVFYLSPLLFTYNLIAAGLKEALYLKNFRAIDYVAVDMLFKTIIAGVSL